MLVTMTFVLPFIKEGFITQDKILRAGKLSPPFHEVIAAIQRLNFRKKVPIKRFIYYLLVRKISIVERFF